MDVLINLLQIKSGQVMLTEDLSTSTVIVKCLPQYLKISVFPVWNIDSIPVGMIDWAWHILIMPKLNESAGRL